MEFESGGLSREEIRKKRRQKERKHALLVLGGIAAAVCLVLGIGIAALVHTSSSNHAQSREAAKEAMLEQQAAEKETAAALAALERLGIAHLAEQSFFRLSGGEQQLVLVARALAQQAYTLVMDEPTASLDYGNQTLVLARASALAREGYTVILSTHNPQHALWYADAVLALQNGRAVAFGAPGEVMNSDLLQRLYGVRTALLQTESGPLVVPLMKGREGGAEDG